MEFWDPVWLVPSLGPTFWVVKGGRNCKDRQEGPYLIVFSLEDHGDFSEEVAGMEIYEMKAKIRDFEPSPYPA